MKISVLYFIIIFLIGCSDKEQSTYLEMKSDKLLSESFTDNELENLAKIVDFFEEQICSEVSEEDIQKCYKKFLKLDSIRLVDDNLLFKLNYNKQKKLYSNLDSTFINSFWVKAKRNSTIDINIEKTIDFEYLSFKVFSKNGISNYTRFLKNLSKKDSLVKLYSERIEVSNDFPPLTGQSVLIYHYNKHNIKDIKIRLIYSFHHLNINEINKYL